MRDTATTITISPAGSVNSFDGDSRLTLIGLSNNVNQQNFSTQDILGVTNNTSNGGGFGGRGEVADDVAVEEVVAFMAVGEAAATAELTSVIFLSDSKPASPTRIQSVRISTTTLTVILRSTRDIFLIIRRTIIFRTLLRHINFSRILSRCTGKRQTPTAAMSTIDSIPARFIYSILQTPLFLRRMCTFNPTIPEAI